MSIQLTTQKLTEALKKSGASAARKNSQMYKNFLTLKPTPENQYYRFRLLYFLDESSSRTIPFIEQYNHVIYNRDENNKVSVDFVTCPTSPYLNMENAWNSCPVCQYVDKQYKLAKDTDWKNKSATTNHRKLRRQFVCFIPVFVVQDPNTPANNGRIMLLKLTDRDAYTRLCDQIKGKEHECSVFNGQQAVDLAVVVSEVPQKNYTTGEININKHTGKPYTNINFKFQFSKKPYDVELPMEQIESMDFDGEIYQYSSVEELNKFLSKYTAPVDVPDNDIDIDLSTNTEEQTSVSVEDDVSFGDVDKTDENIGNIDIDITDIDFDESPTPTQEAQTVDISDKENLIDCDIDLDDVLKDIEGISDIDDII